MLIKSRYRKEMWKNSEMIIKALESIVPVSSIHLRGSFTTRKRRPADVDFIVLLKTGKSSSKSRWSVDFVVVPDNKYGDEVVKDATIWMKQKYGSRNSAVVRLK